ncbi:polymorphic toxin-type HINT domain-containing protein [Actinomadura rubrisoli]|nr:polymorphic toxin-type HINT domain-containing protein [Actinomadura rubrisoli]
MSYTPYLDVLGDAGMAGVLWRKGKHGDAIISAIMILLPVPAGGPLARKFKHYLDGLLGHKPRLPGGGGTGAPDGPAIQNKSARAQSKKPKQDGGGGDAPVGAPRRQSPGCAGNSFVPATEVAMADGTRKPISKVKTGDKVLATDPETGKTRPQPVTAVITGNGTKNLVQITVDTDGPQGHQTGMVIATDNHPFWVGDQQRWMNAGELKPGMWLRTSAGTHIQITAIRAGVQERHVHNLTVNEDHTYYVLAGSAPVLVHNCDLRSISTRQSVPHNRASARIMHAGDGFSGVFDPISGHLEARLSSGPHALVDRFGGHGVTNRESFGGSSDTVGFVAIVRENGLEVRWNSVSVNVRNFGDREAPLEHRDPILNTLRDITGLDVWG